MHLLINPERAKFQVSRKVTLIKQRLKSSNRFDLSHDSRHIELPYENYIKITSVTQHYVSWSRASNVELHEQVSNHEALSEHAQHFSLMRTSKMQHDEIPTEFTQYRRATSEDPSLLSRQSGHLALHQKTPAC